MWQWCSGCTSIHAGTNTEVSGPALDLSPHPPGRPSPVLGDVQGGTWLSASWRLPVAQGKISTRRWTPPTTGQHAPLIIHTTLCLVHCMINYSEKHLLLLLFRILYSIWVLLRNMKWSAIRPAFLLFVQNLFLAFHQASQRASRLQELAIAHMHTVCKHTQRPEMDNQGNVYLFGPTVYIHANTYVRFKCRNNGII